MSDYLIYSELQKPEASAAEITELYAHGYLLGRRYKGDFYESRSVRIDLSKFELSSENRRILRKNEGLTLTADSIPYQDYSWGIHKLGKTFYERFGDSVMSAARIKALFSETSTHSFTTIFTFKNADKAIGYAVCYENSEIIHYAYPFYDLELLNSSLGIGMMTLAIEHAKEIDKKYIYLGTAGSPAAKYKLQFSGLEWWDNGTQKWSADIQQLKDLLG